jgi:hypothetical protein
MISIRKWIGNTLIPNNLVYSCPRVLWNENGLSKLPLWTILPSDCRRMFWIRNRLAILPQWTILPFDIPTDILKRVWDISMPRPIFPIWFLMRVLEQV